MATYTVKKGDTLSQIAKAKGTTVEAIMKANPKIKNKNTINVGQVIQIPTTEAKVNKRDFEKIGKQFDKCLSDIGNLKSVNDLLEML